VSGATTLLLSKKWSLGGLLVILAGFFLHPEGCVSAKQLISTYLPISEDTATHVAILIGTAITALSTGLLHKESTNGST